MAKRLASNTISFESSLGIAKELLRYRILESALSVLGTYILNFDTRTNLLVLISCHSKMFTNLGSPSEAR